VGFRNIGYCMPLSGIELWLSTPLPSLCMTEMCLFLNKKKSKHKRKIKENWTLASLITHSEESHQMWCVWVWSWSLDNEKALAHYRLLRREKGFVRKETGMEGEKSKFIDNFYPTYKLMNCVSTCLLLWQRPLLCSLHKHVPSEVRLSNWNKSH
jgi:hypothetical protein